MDSNGSEQKLQLKEKKSGGKLLYSPSTDSTVFGAQTFESAVESPSSGRSSSFSSSRSVALAGENAVGAKQQWRSALSNPTIFSSVVMEPFSRLKMDITKTDIATNAMLQPL